MKRLLLQTVERIGRRVSLGPPKGFATTIGMGVDAPSDNDVGITSKNRTICTDFVVVVRYKDMRLPAKLKRVLKSENGKLLYQKHPRFNQIGRQRLHQLSALRLFRDSSRLWAPPWAHCMSGGQPVNGCVTSSQLPRAEERCMREQVTVTVPPVRDHRRGGRWKW